jgi:hypothetical protein
MGWWSLEKDGGGGEDNGVIIVEGGKLMKVGAREGEIWGESEN